MNRILIVAAAAAVLGACASPRQRQGERVDTFLVSPVQASVHREGDDLLSAGLGLAGLRSMAPPAFADAAAPTPAEIRRRAIWSNWRGIADLVPGGGYGELFGSVADVPGREFSAFAQLPGANSPHRVLLQLPDQFDRDKRCLLVAVSSGSRGIYGAIAVAGAWGLPRGCAVAYTDKAGGSGYFDVDTQTGVRLDGTRGARGDGLEFAPEAAAPAHTVAVKHLHSRDNPEADWGRHAAQAARFALAQLSEALPQQAPFDFHNTRVIAVGLSNGAGAVLRAAELTDTPFAGVVAIAPNVYADAPGARSLYDYTTEAALYQPCALLHPRFDAVALARPAGAKPPAWQLRCATLAEHGLLKSGDVTAQAQEAYDILHASGWSDAALEAGAISAGFDLWRMVGAGYAAAYGRFGAGEMPCGYRYAALGTDKLPRASTPAERAAWAGDASGIPPGAGVGLIDGMAAGADPTLPGLLCLRELWTGKSADAQRVQAGVRQTRAQPPRTDLPILVVHGTDDGLVPPAFSSAPWVAAARAHGAEVRYWRVHNAQHFDAFLGLPPLAARYLPLLPYGYRALDAMWARVAAQQPLPADAEIATTPRGLQGTAPRALVMPDLGAMPGG